MHLHSSSPHLTTLKSWQWHRSCVRSPGCTQAARNSDAARLQPELHNRSRSIASSAVGATASPGTVHLPFTVLAGAAQAACVTAAALLSSWALLVQPSAAEELSIAFPASSNPEIREAQKTLVESWAYVDNLYVDPNDHTEWAKALQDALGASFKAKSAAEVTTINHELLSQLGDPYTRLLGGEEQDALAAEEDGKIVATGLGLQQLSLSKAAAAEAAPAAPSDNNHQQQQQQQGQEEELLVVSFVVEGSPAAKAGVQEGDAVLSVAGQPVAGKELRDIYRLLSKEAEVTLARQPPLPGSSSDTSSSSSAGSSDSSSSAAAVGALSASAGDPSSADGVLQGVEVYSVLLKPMPLEFEPAQYGIIDLNKAQPSASGTAAVALQTTTSSSSDTTTTTSSSSGDAGMGSSKSSSGSSSKSSSRVGYLKVLTFSSTAPQAVAEALQDIRKEAAQQQGGLAGLIVDLRDNPGGIVEAGVDIAQDFLREGQVLCIAVDKSGQEERVVLPEAHTLTNLPLVVLVNHSTASTSELLAGALHDELHAPLVGTTTYGKGRTQRVIRLADGKSTLLVSTLKYYTPQHSVIDAVGLQPDVVCRPDEVLGQQWVGGKVGGQEQGSLLDDPCIKLAAERLVGGVS